MFPKRWYRWGVLGGCLFVVLIAFFLWDLGTGFFETRVIFLNVGEGDALLLTQGNNQILIDSGRNGKVLLSALGKVLPFWDRTIETAIATHPDADHIGGFSALIDTYRVTQFFSSGAEGDTETSRLLREALIRHPETKGANIFSGAKISFPRGGDLRVIFPETPLPKSFPDDNDGSVTARFEFGKTSFLFTGDLSGEEYRLQNVQPVTVLKVAHHGSKYSTSDTFLSLVRPEEAILSVGKNNYGHPAPEVLDRLSRHGVRVYRTDREGTLIYRCRKQEDGCFLKSYSNR